MRQARYIAHVDMDAFFAAIEQRDNPALRGKPVIVGADPKKGRGRGVVSTCSYEARTFGVHSSLPISIAYRRCPGAVFLPVNMKKYSDVSHQMYALFYNFTPVLEPVSIDEAFLDITSSFHLFGTPLQTCTLIKERIKKETQLTASIGLAPNKMVAKIASDQGKPDGLVEVKQEGLYDFLWPLGIDTLWGLGKKTKVVLNGMGIRTNGDLAKRDVNELEATLGKNGILLWELANGIDQRPVEDEGQAKSVSNEITFGSDTSDQQQIKSALLALCEKVSARLRDDDVKGRTITLKIRLQGFCTYTRAFTLQRATNYVDVLYKQIIMLYDAFKKKGKKVRLVGVKVSHLVSSDFPDFLFNDALDHKREKLHSAVDAIKGKFGTTAIQRAGIHNFKTR